MDIIHFKHLTEKEKELVFRAPALVTYLIGGVDNKFDSTEEAQAKHIVHFRTSTGDPILFDYFTEVEKVFPALLTELERRYEHLSTEERTRVLSEELVGLNEVLPKIDSLYARSLLKSLKSLARSIAEASGGTLGFLDITYEERQIAGLNMITFEP